MNSIQKPCPEHNSRRHFAATPEQSSVAQQSGVSSASLVSQLPRKASSIAETVVTTHRSLGHGDASQSSGQQADAHVSCRDGAAVCPSMASHGQQVATAGPRAHHHEVRSGFGHTFDEPFDACAGNNDESGRHGRDRHTPSRDESNGRGEEAAREGSQVSQPRAAESVQGSAWIHSEKEQQHRQLLRSECVR